MDIPGRLKEEEDAAAIIGSPNITSAAEAAELKEQDAEGHRLNTPWTMWLDKTERGVSAAEYQASLKKVYTMTTVESFWAVYKNIPDVQELNTRYTYHMMRDDRKPLWEEPRNSRGGTWKVKCRKEDSSEVWKELLLACIGEQFDDFVAEDDDICGVSISVRDRDDLIQIWNTNAARQEEAKVIEKVRLLVPRVKFTAIFYKRHETHHAFEGTN
ncbi:eukaryotic translation initiation factor 4E type 3-B-like [Pollicipes pollicipes]|uniref:eukaryotic translation initiation factor 4E type 3-B-like n=1 Tax=Pollicipes pollicipes TaxID=41117 RepID=UPI001884BDDC|nr:eukaryotic translation initiation factor 4E type 3-B-like [Pollicipes pollicipes]XP_037069770.1 eukaryotic translation initiation factor 4E type 3-B-like [Pollicipes pollicipes]XP_037071586.1 eukaryotic translation initiation factor 4E type 3-B-like [Pollicipes pollicipes]XP_037071587.1 eukaryotic translation initiation factor 4E type 3-B-like [Pollicipes pollicipes]